MRIQQLSLCVPGEPRYCPSLVPRDEDDPLTLPRRIQLVKLLRANGLRDVERMREDEMKEALLKLRLVIPDPSKAARSSSSDNSSGAFLARPAEPPPVLDDSDDPYAAPRFREPKLSLPDHQRTFLRAIAVKPRTLFCTWDVQQDARAGLEGPVQVHLFWREFLGDAPSAQELLRQEPAARVDVELGSPGWYINVPGDRLALAAALVVAGPQGARRLAESNLCLTPPARPAPPGPFWVATLPPSLDRRKLAERKVFGADGADLKRVGETDARGVDVVEDDLPSSAERARAPWSALPEGALSSVASMGKSGGKA
jgi:hypothetical protein